MLKEIKNNDAKFELLAVKKRDHQVGSDLQSIPCRVLSKLTVIQLNLSCRLLVIAT